MIQISKSGLVAVPESDVEVLRERFAEHESLNLKQFFDKRLVNYMRSKLSNTAFVNRQEIDKKGEFGRVLFVPRTEPVLFAMHMLLNKPRLFELLQSVTDCLPIGNFSGRIHRSKAAEKHMIEWHDDVSDGRLLAITIDCSSENFSGGELLLRRKSDQEIIASSGHMEPGDAFIFRVSPSLEHQLEPLTGDGARTVAVGWFREKPDWPTFAKNFFQSF